MTMRDKNVVTNWLIIVFTLTKCQYTVNPDIQNKFLFRRLLCLYRCFHWLYAPYAISQEEEKKRKNSFLFFAFVLILQCIDHYQCRFNWFLSFFFVERRI